jgi:predicted phosphohydrolase
MVCGNHEYYGQVIGDINERFTDMAASIENFYFLNNSSVQIDDVKIIGGTMWTDLNRGDWFTLQRIRNLMNDYEYIKYFENPELGNIRLTTTKVREMFAEFREYFESELASGYTGKSVVMTHHAPCSLSISDEYKGDLMNYAYYEDMTKYMFEDNAPQFWVHGHVHNSVNYTIGNTTVRSNPRGYLPKEVNPYFNLNFEFEV